VKIIPCAILLALLCCSAPAQDAPVTFVMAVKECKAARTSAPPRWDVDIGEVFPFVRKMTAAEYTGGADNSDTTYCVVKMDDKFIYIPAECLVAVPAADLVTAATHYNEEVREYRKHYIAPELLARPAPAHHRFTDPAVEALYLKTLNEMHDRNGYWPTYDESIEALNRALRHRH